MFANVLLLASALVAQAPDPNAPAGLKRSAFLGARLVPVPAEAREALKLDQGGARIDATVPGSSAEAAGLKAGDIVTEIGGKTFANPGAFVAVVGDLKAGQEIELKLIRDDKPTTQKIALKGKPLETSEDFAVEYGSVASKGYKLRTIVTRPKEKGRRPALLLIQGLGTFSVDNPPASMGYRRIVEDFSRRGFVTMRVDKPGCGDSEGGPAREVDFLTELDGYRQALKALKALDGVDPENVFIFGHSMGGVMGPILAGEIPVKGVAVYGTLVKTWFEYMVENGRRQIPLYGADPAGVDAHAREVTKLQYALLVEKRSPAEIAKAHPELADKIREDFADDKYYFGRHYRFFQQLADVDLGEAWMKADTFVLAFWGTADYVSSGEDHAEIAKIANGVKEGRGTYRAIEGADHGFHRAGSFAEASQKAQSGQPNELNPAVLEALGGWAKATAKKSK